MHPSLQPEAKFSCVGDTLKLFNDFYCIQAVFAVRVTLIVQLHKGPDLTEEVPSMEVGVVTRNGFDFVLLDHFPSLLLLLFR